MVGPQLPGLVAHRFGRAYGPDSSREALTRSLESEIAGVETDCCLTRDGEIVLLHEPLLDAATTLSGWVREHDAAEIRRSELRTATGAASGQHPLLLEQALDLLVGRDLLVQLEVKAYADEQLALATTDALCDLFTAGAAAPRVELISFWPASCARAAGRGFATRLIVACAYEPEALARWARDAGVGGVILEGPYFAAEPLRIWRQAGLSVMSGVVNEAAYLRRVLRFSPDLIATDRPAEILAEMGRE